MNLTLKRNNENINFTKLVGLESEKNGYSILIYEWNEQTKNLNVVIKDLNRNQLGTESLSLAFGLEVFIEKLKEYGFDIVIEDGIIYSLETIQKAQGLILAGFNKLIRVEDNYFVDNVFLQTFLSDTELQCLLKDDVLELNLADIK